MKRSPIDLVRTIIATKYSYSDVQSPEVLALLGDVEEDIVLLMQEVINHPENFILHTDYTEINGATIDIPHDVDDSN